MQGAQTSLNNVINFAHTSFRYRSGQLRLIGQRMCYRLPEIDLEQIAPGATNEVVFIRDDACLPPHRGPWKHDDVTPLLRIVRHLQPSIVLELGTAQGNTTANICANSSAHVVTVNALPEEISGDVTTFALTRDEIGRAYRNNGFEDRVTQVYANTLDFDYREWVQAQSVDLAIIDACHDTPYVLNDFQKVVPAMRKHGVVLLHDTDPQLGWHLAGSTIACARLRRKGFDIRHVRGTWWGIWRNP